MSGLTITDRIDTQEELPELGRTLSIFPLQADSASLAVNLDAGSQDENEAFRRGWKAIVGALYSLDKGSGELVWTGDSSRNVDVANSAKQVVAVVEGTSGASKGKVAAAIGTPRSDSDSTANSAAPRPRAILRMLPALDAITTDSNQRMATEPAEQSTFHAPKVARKSGQSAKEQDSQVQTTTATAPDSLLMICQPAAPQAEIPQAAESMARSSLPASESESWSGISPGNPARDVVVATAGVVRSSVTERQQTSTAAAKVESEGDTTQGHGSSHLSPMRTNQEPDSASALVSMQKQTAEVEQGRPPIPNDTSIRPTAIYPPGALIASENPIKPNDAAEAEFDWGSRSMHHLTGSLKRQETRHDRSGIDAVQSSPPVKSAIHPVIQSQPVADARNAAFDQTRSGLVPPASAASMASSPNPGVPTVTEGKTAAVHETFAAMDAGMNDGATRWIRADSHRAEAGFQDASLGWVSVRAQAGAAGIHASIMPSSDAAAEVLSGHLAGLNAHMANHYEHLNAVTLSTPGDEGGGHDTGNELAQGSGHAPNHDGGQQTQENSRPVPSGPARDSTHGQLRERTNPEVQVFTAGMNPQGLHISAVV